MRRAAASALAALAVIAVTAIEGGALRAQTVSPSISPARIAVDSPIGQGDTVRLPALAVTNRAHEAAIVRMSVVPVDDEAAGDVDPAWVHFSPASFELAAGEGQSVELVLAVPRDAPPGAYCTRLRAKVAPTEDEPGVAVAVRAAVATDLRFVVEDRDHGALDTARALLRRYGLGVALACAAGAVTLGWLELRRRYRLFAPREQ